MWLALRIVSGVLLLAVYGWLLSRPRPAPRSEPTRWQRFLQSGVLTVVVAIGLPLAGLTLIFGTGLWKVLVAGWIYVLGGGMLGLGAAFLWELVSRRMEPDRRDTLGRVIFWTFFALGGLGLLLLAWRVWLQLAA